MKYLKPKMISFTTILFFIGVAIFDTNRDVKIFFSALSIGNFLGVAIISFFLEDWW